MSSIADLNASPTLRLDLFPSMLLRCLRHQLNPESPKVQHSQRDGGGICGESGCACCTGVAATAVPCASASTSLN